MQFSRLSSSRMVVPLPSSRCPAEGNRIFSGAFGAVQFRPNNFFGAFSASHNSASPAGGVPPPHSPSTPEAQLGGGGAIEGDGLVSSRTVLWPPNERPLARPEAGQQRPRPRGPACWPPHGNGAPSQRLRIRDPDRLLLGAPPQPAPFRGNPVTGGAGTREKFGRANPIRKRCVQCVSLFQRLARHIFSASPARSQTPAQRPSGARTARTLPSKTCFCPSQRDAVTCCRGQTALDWRQCDGEPWPMVPSPTSPAQ